MVCQSEAYLFYCPQRPSGYLYLHELLQGIRKQTFRVYVWEPTSARFLFGERYAVSVLLGFALEQA